MARKAGGATAILGLGVGVAAFFLLSKQPITGSVIKFLDDGISKLKGTPAKSTPGQTAGTPPANVTTDPIVMAGDVVKPTGISLLYGGPGEVQTESGPITSLPDWIPLITG